MEKTNPDANRMWLKTHPEQTKAKAKRSREQLKTKLKRNERHKIRKQTDIEYKLACNLRNRTCVIIRQKIIKGQTGVVKAGSAVKDLGCSLEFLKQYIESKFQEGMTWENYGRTGWHIDHIVPLTNFDLTDREQFLKASHYTNLQPLWALDNILKYNKFPTDL
jgi:hypothetical protein